MLLREAGAGAASNDGPCLFGAGAMRVNVYIDGFNLYYGLRETRCKWLNPLALAQRLMPEHTIAHIHYFTARVTAPPGDPGKPQRQDVFIRALGTIPNLTLHWGQFVSHP